MKKPILIGVIAFVGLFLGLTGLLFSNRGQTFSVIPSDAIVQLDGKTQPLSQTYKTGRGPHALSISRAGFTPLKTTFSGDRTGSELFTLDPNSAVGYDWLQNHPDQELAREGAGGAAFEKSSTALSSQNPLVKMLPFKLSNLRIDYGTVDKRLIIYVSAAAPADRLEAIQLIRGFGYDPSDYVIVFKTPTGDLR
ncbi:MAG: hypothetical protein ABI602_01110 [Candidatus Saccharibacteria bacterium]